MILILCNFWCHAVPDAMQFLMHYNSWCNIYPNAMKFPMQYNTRYNAIPNTLQFPMQCNSWYNGFPDAMQFLMQCNSWGNAIPDGIAQSKWSKCTTAINFTLKGPVVSSLARFFLCVFYIIFVKMWLVFLSILSCHSSRGYLSYDDAICLVSWMPWIPIFCYPADQTGSYMARLYKTMQGQAAHYCLTLARFRPYQALSGLWQG